jgi:hypothetical protein
MPIHLPAELTATALLGLGRYKKKSLGNWTWMEMADQLIVTCCEKKVKKSTRSLLVDSSF